MRAKTARTVSHLTQEAVTARRDCPGGGLASIRERNEAANTVRDNERNDQETPPNAP